MELQETAALLMIGALSFITHLPCLFGNDFLIEDLPAIVYNQDVSGDNVSWISIISNDFHGKDMSLENHESYRQR